jgi:predicted  nucleic acid-binding Zn-ribbon protein
LRHALAREAAKEAARKIELDDLRRRCEAAESHGRRVSDRVSEAERELDAFNHAVALGSEGRERELEDRLVLAESTRVELERELVRVSQELERMRNVLESDTPELARMRAQLDAKEARERDLISALKYEERIRDEAVREMYRARAAAAKAEAFASKCSSKASQSQALATVIQSLGDSLFEY